MRRYILVLVLEIVQLLPFELQFKQNSGNFLTFLPLHKLLLTRNREFKSMHSSDRVDAPHTSTNSVADVVIENLDYLTYRSYMRLLDLPR